MSTEQNTEQELIERYWKKRRREEKRFKRQAKLVKPTATVVTVAFREITRAMPSPEEVAKRQAEQAEQAARRQAEEAEWQERKRKQIEEKERQAEEARLLFATMPERHRLKNGLTGEQWKLKFEYLRERLGTGFFCMLIGPPRTGKTQMAVELIKATIYNRKSGARFTNAIDLFLGIRNTIQLSRYSYDGPKRPTTEEEFLEGYYHPSLLVIDEFHRRSETPFENGRLFKIINDRYNAATKDTLLLGNLTQEEILQTMDPAILSRLAETGGFIECNWEPFLEVENPTENDSYENMQTQNPNTDSHAEAERKKREPGQRNTAIDSTRPQQT